MAVYTRQMAADNSQEVSRLKRNLIRALKEDVTAKQRQVLLLYYAEGLNMREIGEQLGVDKSTISRTIKRGERRLQRCLRYGAEAYLKSMDQESGPPSCGSVAACVIIVISCLGLHASRGQAD